MNPLLEREWRSRFRLRKTYLWLFALVGAVSWLIVWRYSSWFDASGKVWGADVSNGDIFGQLGADLYRYLAPLQVLIALLISPSLTAATLAGEREQGTLDLLLLTRMSPWQIVLGRWLSGLAFAFMLLLALWPINMVILLLGGVSPSQIRVVLALTVSAVIFGTSLGLGVSAWRRRAYHSLRSANSFVMGWLIFSTIMSYMSGLVFTGGTINTFSPLYWVALSNPIMPVVDIGWPLRSSEEWKYPLMTMLIIAGLSLWSAKIGLSKIQDGAPMIELGPKSVQGSPSPQNSTFEVPFFSRWYTANPVFGRELRAKFRARKPPLIFILVEGLLALAVAAAYIWAFYQALTEPESRPIVFWGVYFTGLVVTLLAAATLGASAFSRERENGTWESVKLSSLTPSDLIRGKMGAILLTPLVYSLPIWPLIIPCIHWKAGFVLSARPDVDGILPTQLGAAILIWLGSVWGMSALSLNIGHRFSKTSAAVGWSLGAAFAWSVVLPIVVSLSSNHTDFLMNVLSPFSAMLGLFEYYQSSWWNSSGMPFFAFTLLWGAFCLHNCRERIRHEFENDLPSLHR